MHIEDVSPRDGNTVLHFNRDFQSVSGKALCCALSADGARAYVGGHSGVWRSDDGGATWFHPEWPQPAAGSTSVPGALLAPNVYDLLISSASSDIVLAATGRDARRPDQSGIYRSTDGARNWTLVHQFTRTVGDATVVSGMVGCLAVASDDPNLMYAAGGFAVARSTNGGATWTDIGPPLASFDSVFYVVVGPREAIFRRVYAFGTRVWYSLDGGVNWQIDPQSISLGAPADGAGSSSRSVGIHPREPGIAYVLVGDGAVLWRGQFPPIPSTGPGVWSQLPTPRKDFPGTTASGGGFVVPHVTSQGLLCLVVSDRRTTNLVANEPAAESDWRRVEDAACHLDPHGFALTPDFHPQLPYGRRPPRFGRALLVNDGGANTSIDGALTWRNGQGLSTLGIVNVAVNAERGRSTAICMGMGDNSGFSSPDGGANWETQDYVGGDNDCCFTDPLQPNRLFVFSPRSGKQLFVYTGSDGHAPDAALGTSQRRGIDSPPPLPNAGDRSRGHNMVSNFYNVGYRPLVLTRHGEALRPDGDLVLIRFTASEALLLRTTRVSEITSPDDWVTSATAESPSAKTFQQGPPLPDPDVCAVQASGGHDAPTFYAGDQGTGTRPGALRLWKWTRGMTAWQQVVPGALIGGAPVPAIARRFFVDPYRPALVYVLDRDHVRRSDNGGATWVVDMGLEGVLTENGAFPFDIPNDGNPGEALVRDMLFDPERPGCRFAVGPAGVFQTQDGLTWMALVRSSALAMRPNNAAYDPVSCDRALYVATSARGLLRLSPIPPDWGFPIGSLQAAEGRITLLRVHDAGSGFGPPHDALDAEVVVLLDTQPEKAFGFQLRPDADLPKAKGMLDLLRDIFARNTVARLEFVRSGCRTAHIVRVIER